MAHRTPSTLPFATFSAPSMKVTKHATTAPDWFHRAVATPADSRFVSVGGCRIHYLRWSRTGKPGLCFVHGGFAHAHWWDWIAPFFADAFSVVALDLGGMGDSGHQRSEERRVGKECLKQCRSRWSPYH